MRPIPTAQQIVDVFIKNGWTKTCSKIMRVPKDDPMHKMCCAMPALAEIAGIRWEKGLVKNGQRDAAGRTVYDHDSLYGLLSKEYGVQGDAIWVSFDDGKPRYTGSKTKRDTEMSRVCAEASNMLEGVKRCDLDTLASTPN